MTAQLWPTGVAEAEALQREMAARVEIPEGPVPPPRTVVGLDVSYSRRSDEVVAAAVAMDVVSLRVIEEAVVTTTVDFPYVPGLLAFREAPPLLEALERLTVAVDLLLCDGQGLAHPRRCGVACHLGVLTGLAAVGCAKNHLTGAHDEPGMRRGDRSPLVDDGAVLGHALRTQDGVRPVYVSPGHHIGTEQSAELVLALCRHRLPEPLRRADHVGRLALKERS